MNEAEEKAYSQGVRQAWTGILYSALKELGWNAESDLEKLELRVAVLTLQREGAVNALRNACRAHGDNDWPDDLSLADVINKHLVCYLEE